MTLGSRFPNSSKMMTPMMIISIGPGMPKKTAKGRDTAETSEIEITRVARGDTPAVSVGVKVHYIAAIRAVKLPFGHSAFGSPAARDGSVCSSRTPIAGDRGPAGLGRHGSRSKACSQNVTVLSALAITVMPLSVTRKPRARSASES